MKKKGRKQEQPISLTRRNLIFKSGNKSLSVSVNTNISAYEFVTDLLTVNTAIFDGKRRYVASRPLYSPEDASVPTETRKTELKRLKSEWHKICGTGYRPTSIGLLADGMLQERLCH